MLIMRCATVSFFNAWLVAFPMSKSALLASRRILVAEDESVIALGLEDALASFGCEVLGPVARPGDVLKIIERERVDGALLDINLRGEQIFSALPAVLARGIPVIITSGYGDLTLFPEEFRDLPRVTKPFDFVRLERLCAAVFATPKT